MTSSTTRIDWNVPVVLLLKLRGSPAGFDARNVLVSIPSSVGRTVTENATLAPTARLPASQAAMLPDPVQVPPDTAALMKSTPASSVTSNRTPGAANGPSLLTVAVYVVTP